MSDTIKPKMSNKDIVDMAQRSIDEITVLRAEVTYLAPKAAAYDAIVQILGLLPRASRGASEDVVWRLKEQVRQIRKSEEAE